MTLPVGFHPPIRASYAVTLLAGRYDFEGVDYLVSAYDATNAAAHVAETLGTRAGSKAGGLIHLDGGGFLWVRGLGELADARQTEFLARASVACSAVPHASTQQKDTQA